MKRKLRIEKGVWTKTTNEEVALIKKLMEKLYDDVADLQEFRINVGAHTMAIKCYSDNRDLMRLLIDAGNTYNECGMMPSELLNLSKN